MPTKHVHWFSMSNILPTVQTYDHPYMRSFLKRSATKIYPRITSAYNCSQLRLHFSSRLQIVFHTSFPLQAASYQITITKPTT
jgi:hypothetical protein